MMAERQDQETPVQQKVSARKAMDAILDQWQKERPDIDTSPMAVCGQVWRAAEILKQGVLSNLSKHKLDMAGFDVLLTLRRQGKGQTLSPSALAKEMMLSAAAMTNRLDRLEKRGLLVRMADASDRRSLQVALSDEGFALADELVVSHVATEDRMLGKLDTKERETLRHLLEKISL